MRSLMPVGLCLALAACDAAGPGGGAATGGAVTVAAPGELMTPGQVGRTCNLGRRDRGVEVARFPTEGRARWRIYDTAPGSTQPRAQYITGFSDGCARKVTAALLVFGAPSVHEPTRYHPANRTRFSATDNAYERIKAAICGVRPGARCPADRIERLEQRTAFVSVYPTFGGTGRQLELLLDRGDLVAQTTTGL